MKRYVFDLERKLFWKKNKYGYTTELTEALTVNSIEEAEEVMSLDYDGNTIVLDQRTSEQLLRTTKL